MMTKNEKAKYVWEKLEEIYPTVPIPLDHTNDFELLIAVLLSAQCTDKRVNIITPALFAKADNAYDMQKLSLDEVEGFIKTCGLYKSKARNIKKLAIRNDFPARAQRACIIVFFIVFDRKAPTVHLKLIYRETRALIVYFIEDVYARLDQSACGRKPKEVRIS